MGDELGTFNELKSIELGCRGKDTRHQRPLQAGAESSPNWALWITKKTLGLAHSTVGARDGFEQKRNVIRQTLKKDHSGDFPGNPVVNTPHFQGRRLGFSPCSEN